MLKLQWRSIDLEAGEIRLDAGTTKNEGRGIPFDRHEELRTTIETLHAERGPGEGRHDLSVRVSSERETDQGLPR
jgi:hypothetical protein